MFGFLKKNKLNISAMVSGELKSIDKCIDEVFAQKMMGDGFLITPNSNEIYSPVDGEVVMTFPTKHAIGLKDNKGNEYLIHIGIDTVNLNGEGFEGFVKQGDKVSKGDLLIKCDFKAIEPKVKSTDVVLILTDKRTCRVYEEKTVTAKEVDIVEIDGGK